MSFPYRLISALTTSEAAQVISLRLINVGILAGAIVVFRRLLAQLGASNAMRNVVMAFFVLTPVVPFLGAQINYDSLLVLMAALAFSTYLSFRSSLRDQKLWLWSKFAQLALICLAASLVKYAFLPLAAGLAIAVIVDWRYALRSRVILIPKRKNMKLVAVYGLLLVVSLGLFGERYLVNTVRYHTPIPECNQVLSVEECKGYAPWARNYMYASWHIEPKTSEKLVYPFVWIYRGLDETVFTLTSRFNEKGTVSYFGADPLPIPNALSWIVFVGGGLLAIGYRRTIGQNKNLCALLAVSGLYVLALFAQNLLDFLHLGFTVAVHGRYLLPLMPLFYFAIAIAVGKLIERFTSTESVQAGRKALLTGAVLGVFALEGGGFVTFIMRSQADWFWPQSQPAQLANQYARNALKYVVIDR